MALRILDSRRYSRLIGQRNERLHAVLAFVRSQGTVVSAEIASHFNVSVTIVQKATQELVARNFLTCTTERHTITKGRGAGPGVCMRKRYAATKYTHAELLASLPITLEQAEAAGFTLHYRAEPKVVIPRFVKSSPRPALFRDPLDIALMGTGIAPSIIFQRGNHANA